MDASVDPRYLQLWVDGEERPLAVRGEGDGRFDMHDTLEFYGVGLDTPFTDTRTYWLVEGIHPGRRVETLRSRSRGREFPASFPATVAHRERLFYFPALRNGETENFFGALVTSEPLEQVVHLPHPDTAAVQEARLEVTLQGATTALHQVQVGFNDVVVGEAVFEELSQGTLSVPLPQAALLEGDNLVTLTAQGGEMDVSLVASIQVTYAHTYRADGDMLHFTARGGEVLAVDGFSTRRVLVLDLTEPDRVVRLEGQVRGDPRSGFTVTFQVPGRGERLLAAVAAPRHKTPAAIAGNAPSAWHDEGHASDLVIIAHGDLLESLEPLAAWRQSQGWTVALIDVQDLYDEFTFGHKNPRALRDFLGHTRARWQVPPRFVLLAGDASFDPRNYLGLGDFDLVPTRLIDTAYMETASDDWFADLDDDGVPELAVGRLPVRTPEEAARVAAKLMAYDEAASPLPEALLVADAADGAFDFERASREVAALLPDTLDIGEIYLDRDPAAGDTLLERLNWGPLLVNYIGHGSVEVWSDDLFSADDARALTNGPHLPFVIAMTCLNGLFHDLYSAESLAEALLHAEEGGAVAVWASSGLTLPEGQAVMNQALVRFLFNGEGLTLGEAAMAAKAAATDPDVRRTWVLFGDPTTRLR
jgi:hypothetical protein